jgi:hypothetical protein
MVHRKGLPVCIPAKGWVYSDIRDFCLRGEDFLMKKWNLKLLYLLSLGALCLLVTTGPAGATVSNSPMFESALVQDVNAPLMNVMQFPNFEWSASDQEVDLTLQMQCTGTGCSADVSFWLLALNTDYITVALNGTSSDTGASGYVEFAGGAEQSWTVDGDGDLVMEPFNVPVAQGGSINGDFVISELAPGAYLSMLDPLDITANSGSAVPEPASALLLVGGIAFVEFLRRKSRA